MTWKKNGRNEGMEITSERGPVMVNIESVIFLIMDVYKVESKNPSNEGVQCMYVESDFHVFHVVTVIYNHIFDGYIICTNAV